MCDIMMKQDRVQMSPADFVKVPFLQALELVSHRRVFVQNGIAYVPRDRLMTIIITRFRASVSLVQYCLSPAVGTFEVRSSPAALPSHTKPFPQF